MVAEEEAKVEFVKSNKAKYIKLLMGFLIVLTIVILVLVKIKTPETKLRWIIIPGSIVLFVALVGIFWNKLGKFFVKKEGTDENIPEPIGEEDLYEFVRKMNWNKSFENHFKVSEINPFTFGKNKIYEIKCVSPYHDEVQKGFCHIFVNSNYPKLTPAIRWNLNPAQSKSVANRMSMSPIDEPDTDETQTRIDPLTKEIISREIKRIRHHKRTKLDKIES